MAFEPVLQSTEEKLEFAKIMSSPNKLGFTNEEIAKRFGISIPTIYNKLRDEEIKKLIKGYRTDAIERELPAVDDALLKKAKSGNIPAIELLYERWDGFIRRSATLQANINQPPEDPKEIKERKARVKDYIEGLKLLGKPPLATITSTIYNEGTDAAAIYKEGSEIVHNPVDTVDNLEPTQPNSLSSGLEANQADNSAAINMPDSRADGDDPRPPDFDPDTLPGIPSSSAPVASAANFEDNMDSGSIIEQVEEEPPVEDYPGIEVADAPTPEKLYPVDPDLPSSRELNRMMKNIVSKMNSLSVERERSEALEKLDKESEGDSFKANP